MVVNISPYELWHDRKLSLACLCPWGLASYVHNPIHKHGTLSPRAIKMVFIPYPEYSKGYVMYSEHFNCGMTEAYSCNADFRVSEFSSFSDITMDLALYELPLHDQLSLGEGENMNTHRVTEDSTPLSGRG